VLHRAAHADSAKYRRLGLQQPRQRRQWLAGNDALLVRLLKAHTSHARLRAQALVGLRWALAAAVAAVTTN
jgi:hypothetical protein